MKQNSAHRFKIPHKVFAKKSSSSLLLIPLTIERGWEGEADAQGEGVRPAAGDAGAAGTAAAAQGAGWPPSPLSGGGAARGVV
jgi:hypothetical protein